MTKNDIYTLLLVVEGIAIVVLSILLFNACSKPADIEYIEVEVRDTITVQKERIVEHTKVQYVTKYDTVVQYVALNDTVLIPVELPIEHMVYEDTITTDSTEVELSIKYSGFKPSLDSIGISYQWHREKPLEARKSGFRSFLGVGCYAGVGVGYDYRDKTFNLGTPEVGIALIYGFGWTWDKK